MEHRQSLATGEWFSLLWQQQMAPGLFNTLILGQISLVFTGLLALLLFLLIRYCFFAAGDGPPEMVC